MNIAQWLYSRALVSPDSAALFSGTMQRADYRQFAAQAAALARYIAVQHHVGTGDRVAIYMANRVEYLVVMYAAWWLGAVIVPINAKLHIKEAAWILENSQSTVLFTDAGDAFDAVGLPQGCTEIGIDTPAFSDALNTLASTQSAQSGAETTGTPAPADVHGDALAWLFYTSGTTGRPKGVMLSHANLMAMALCYPMDVDHVSASDATLYAAPMSHGAGLYNFMYVRAGARHVVPESRGFESTEIMDVSRTLRHVSLFAAPTMVKRLVAAAKAENRDGDGIRTIVLGGGPMYAADLVEALDVLGPRFAQIYGQGESPMTITAISGDIINDRTHPDWMARLASVGIAQSCMQVRVVDASMKDVAPGECGEIITRGAAVMQGYWQNPEATHETLVDGWLHTGDIGYLSADGFLTLTDRSKDVIISGGSNIYPREVEEALASHPDVFEVAVIGQPHAEWGEIVCAFIVSRGDKPIAISALDTWCKEHIASFKKPKRYLFRQTLPKNSYGKTLKTALREEATQSRQDSSDAGIVPAS